VALHPDITRAQYQQIFAAAPEQLPEFIREAVAQTASDRLMVLSVSTPLRPGSSEAHALVRLIRHQHPSTGGEVLVTGQSAVDLDLAETIAHHAPMTVAVIVVATYVVLFLLLGSLLLPLKAVVMNVLSISASYGALVWIFQEGHLAHLLGFTPGPIETSTPIIMFCVMFGLSMDYEVLLLSRVREEYERTGDNTPGGGVGARADGPAHHRAPPPSWPRSSSLSAPPTGTHSGHRHRHGHRGGGGRHHRARPARPRHHAAHGRVELVGTRDARPSAPPPRLRRDALGAGAPARPARGRAWRRIGPCPRPTMSSSLAAAPPATPPRCSPPASAFARFVVERFASGGQVLNCERIDNYPGFPTASRATPWARPFSSRRTRRAPSCA
jgi:hypothetical protein